ncbi:hypothetical protein [Isoalcanivorax beigongshangi]|uniref:Uncharacterized protein n=1 Tax=Isoalcanivorax beigongshangi TaxID=3238810 RepID=A0ABV4AGD1_9GAMM
MTGFNIFFAGEVARGEAPEQVQSRLQQLFRLNDSAAAALFSGRRVQLKKGVDQATMMRFKAALRQAGALCEVEPAAPVTTAVTAPVPAPAAEPRSADIAGAASDRVSGQAETGADLDMVGTIRRGGSGFSGAFSVSEVGADLGVQQQAVTSVAPDISHLSLAPVGAVLENAVSGEVPATPDTSHLTLVP